MKRLFIALLLATVTAVPLYAQTVCHSGVNGEIVCEPESHPSGKRLAIIAAVIVGVAVVAIIIRHHRHHDRLRRAENHVQPKPQRARK